LVAPVYRALVRPTRCIPAARTATDAGSFTWSASKRWRSIISGLHGLINRIVVRLKLSFAPLSATPSSPAVATDEQPNAKSVTIKIFVIDPPC
jgi:hypothetical protein